MQQVSIMLHPTCPLCGAESDDDGAIYPEELPVFKWRCPDCGAILTGSYLPTYQSAQWYGYTTGLKARIMYLIHKFIVGVLLHNE